MIWLILIVNFLTAFAIDDYRERLFVKQVDKFSTAINIQYEFIKTDEINKFVYFPNEFYYFLNSTQAEEFRFSLTKGIWNEKIWGFPFLDTLSSSAEVFSTVYGDERLITWNKIILGLSGYFCSSVDDLRKLKNLISPLNQDFSGNSTLFHAILASEVICSENLKPWFNLLPLKRSAGIASLIDYQILHRSKYISLSISGQKSFETSEKKLNMDLTFVVDENFVPQKPNSVDLSRILLFNAYKPGLFKKESTLFIMPSEYLKEFQVKFDGISSLQNNLTARELELNNITNIFFKTTKESSVNEKETNFTPLSVTKYNTGVGDWSGGIRNLIENSNNVPLNVKVTEIVPEILSLFLSSLNVSYRPIDCDLCQNIGIDYSLKAQLGLENTRMTVMNIQLIIPPKSNVKMEYNFLKKIQSWIKYPSDANRGIILPPTIISYSLNSANFLNRNSTEFESFHGDVMKIRTSSSLILIRMPLPDFSMPFNVLCMVCSVIAVLFTSIFKSCTINLTVVDKDNMPNHFLMKIPILYKLYSLIKKDV